jgi:hypothetical protein
MADYSRNLVPAIPAPAIAAAISALEYSETAIRRRLMLLVQAELEVWKHILFTNYTSISNLLPNIGRPLFDSSRVASSWIASQCSTKIPSFIRTMSSAIQFTGWP